MFIKAGNRVVNSDRIDVVELDHADGSVVVYIAGLAVTFVGEQADRLRALFGGERFEVPDDLWDEPPLMLVIDLMAFKSVPAQPAEQADEPSAAETHDDGQG